MSIFKDIFSRLGNLATNPIGGGLAGGVNLTDTAPSGRGAPATSLLTLVGAPFQGRRDQAAATETQRVTRTRAVTYIMLAVALFVGFVLLRDSAWQGTKELHTLMEVVATFLALFVGVMALVRFYSKKNNTFLLIGAGFLGTGFLDGYHAVVTSSFFAHLFPSGLSSLIPWSWVASRTFLSLLMWLSWLAWRREVRLGEAGKIGERAIYAFVVFLTMASFLFFAFVPLPRAYYPELYFHRPEEFVPALFFLLALVGYLTKGQWKHDAFEHWVVLSLIVGLVGQAAFMSLSGQLFDMMFDAAHTLKKMSYICVLIGLVISMYGLFRKAEESAEAIASINAELEVKNAELERQVAVRHRAERTLAERAEELARSNEDLERFTHVASHDLQEPLRAVASYTQLLAKRYTGRLDADADEFIGFVVSGVNRMQRLINDLLAYSRVGSAGTRSEPIDCTNAYQAARANLRAQIEESGAEVTGDTLPIVTADETQLVQLFQNLIGNAIKYRSDEPSRVHISAVQGDGEWKFRVRDNGIGIDAQYGEQIFEMFRRLHTPAEYPGTGAGLAICKKIVERWGGRIWVESRIGGGSTFCFTIPDRGSMSRGIA